MCYLCINNHIRYLRKKSTTPVENKLTGVGVSSHDRHQETRCSRIARRAQVRQAQVPELLLQESLELRSVVWPRAHEHLVLHREVEAAALLQRLPYIKWELN